MIKKIIFACMLSLLGVTLMACGGKTVLAPSITNGDSIYLSVTEGEDRKSVV